MRRFTRYMVEIVRCLDTKGWVDGGTIAAALGTPLANIKTSLSRLIREGLVEGGELSRPTRYRIAETLNADQRIVLERLRTTKEFDAPVP